MVTYISSHMLQQAGLRVKNTNSVLKLHFPGIISRNKAQGNATAKSEENLPRHPGMLQLFCQHKLLKGFKGVFPSQICRLC